MSKDGFSPPKLMKNPLRSKGQIVNNLMMQLIQSWEIIIIHEKLFNDFMLLIILKNILKKLHLTCFDLYTELDIVEQKMLGYKIPEGN
jgi:hypothetical protein